MDKLVIGLYIFALVCLAQGFVLRIAYQITEKKRVYEAFMFNVIGALVAMIVATGITQFTQ